MAAELVLGASSPTKTFVIEAHTADPKAFLAELAGPANVEHTEDVNLFKVTTDGGPLWVDQLNARFWSVHTDMLSSRASAVVNTWVGRHHELDWMWLPSNHLRHLWPGGRT